MTSWTIGVIIALACFFGAGMICGGCLVLAALCFGWFPFKS